MRTRRRHAPASESPAADTSTELQRRSSCDRRAFGGSDEARQAAQQLDAPPAAEYGAHDFEEADEDESFASFLGSDEDDDLGDDAELLSILGIGGGGDEEPAQASAPAPAVPVASSESYDTMKVPELKALLKERGLKVGGKKAELVARLREAA